MKRILFLSLLIVLALFLSSCATTQYYTGSVYLPTWGHLYCGQKPEQIPNAQDTGLFTLNNNNKQEYFCSAPTLRAYMPNGCDVEVKRPFALINPKTYICDGAETNVDNCQVFAIGSCNSGTWCPLGHISYGQKIVFINGKDSYQIQFKAQPYGIWNQELGHLIITSSCDVKSLGAGYTQMFEDYKLEDYTQSTVLIVGHIVNYVTGSTLVSDPTNVITHNGKLVYISQPNYYYEVKDSKDGKKYVDTRTSIYDASIVCVPSNPYCKDDASGIINSPDGKSCGELSGSIEGYVQVDSSEMCKFKCVGDKLVRTTDCKKIPTSCPPEKPLWDSIRAECVGVGILSVCGDGVCTGKENAFTCPEDCTKNCKPLWAIDLLLTKITIIPDLKCLFLPQFIYLSIAAGALILLFSYLALSKKYNKKDQKSVVWIISTILGITGGLLFWWLWYLWIILLIIIIILNITL